MKNGLATSLPESYFDDLQNLAKASRILQDAFSGKLIDAKFYRGKTSNSIIKRAVPSMRDLSTIVNKWAEDGYRLSLDYYLWKYYIQKFGDDKDEQEGTVNFSCGFYL